MHSEIGLLNMLLWSINTEPLGGNLEFCSGVAETKKGQQPDQDSDGLWLGFLQRARVHSLGVVSEPVPGGQISRVLCDTDEERERTRSRLS
jgi:hypothetical protein